jgi:hypothetical protein
LEGTYKPPQERGFVNTSEPWFSVDSYGGEAAGPAEPGDFTGPLGLRIGSGAGCRSDAFDPLSSNGSSVLSLAE